MEAPREPTDAERDEAELFERIRAWLMEWKKDELVLLATVLMVANGLSAAPSRPR